MGASTSTFGSLQAKQQSSLANVNELADKVPNVSKQHLRVKVNRQNKPIKPNQQACQPSQPSIPPEASQPSGILHLAIERRVAPIQGHDGGNIMVLHKVGVLAKLVFLDGDNQVQVDKLRAALGVLHSKDAHVYVVHDYNARGIPGTRKVHLLFATTSVLQSSLDVWNYENNKAQKARF